MNLAARAEGNGVARVTACRWFRAGLLPVPARRGGRLILVDEPSSETGVCGRTAVYARVSSADQKADLDRQVARVTAWATDQQFPVDRVVTEVGSALNGHRRKFVALLRDQSVTRIVVEHRHRFCRFGSEYVQAALAAQGRELVVVDSAEVDDDPVGGYDRDPDLDVRKVVRKTCRGPRGRIVVEGLDAAGMLRQKGLPGARTRRRGLSDSALGTPRRHLSYKTGWYGSALVVADRWFPSSKKCHACGHVQDIGWDERWQCDGCSVTHQRDDNAAINLARYEEPSSVVGPVGAAVKRGADRKTKPRSAGGCEARKGTGHPVGEQPPDGVQVA